MIGILEKVRKEGLTEKVGFLKYSFIYYLKSRIPERGEIEMDLPSAGSLCKQPQWPDLAHSEATFQELPLGLPGEWVEARNQSLI